MTVHKLSAGDGYAYYTNEVASADELRAGDRDLGDYYTVEGMPPGQWIAHSQDLLEVSGEVAEDQMRALYGEGLHPEADARLAAGETLAQVRLGARYKQVTTADNDFTRRYGEELARHERTVGQAPTAVQKKEIRGRVAGEVFRAMHGREVASSEELGRFITAQSTAKQQAVAGYDLVFAPSKSVSMLWGLGGESARTQIEAAHEDAIREAISYLEREATYTRRGRNGVRQIEVQHGLVGTKFRHYDSRTGDPQLHDHVVISNKVKGVDGKWSALDGRTLYKMGVSASEVYNQKVIANVCERLGVQAVQRSTGADQTVMEIAGISPETIARASGRRSSIASQLERLAEDYRARHGHEPSVAQRLKLAQQATLETRPAKKDARRLSDLVEQWQHDYARDLGIPTGAKLLAKVRAARTDTPVAGLGSVEDTARAVVHDLSQKRSTWGVNHVRAETLRHVARAAPGAQVSQTMIESVVKNATDQHSLSMATHRPELPDLAEFTRRDGSSQFVRAEAALFTSAEVIAAEHAVLAAAQRTVVPQIHAEHFQQAVSAHQGPMNAAQRELARGFACDEKLFTVAVGPAGTGKTTSLRLAAETIRAADHQVIALAPTAAAAAVMAQEIQAPATTIDAFLTDRPGRPGPSQLGRGDVLIVDEVGMVATPKLAEVIGHAQRAGAVVRGIGDDRQLGAIGSGGALRLVTREVGARHLDQVHRFRTPGEDAASLTLREPPATGADTPWAWYQEQGRIVAGDTEVMTSRALAGWAADTAAGKTSLLVASDNATVTELNRRAQAMRQAEHVVPTTGACVELNEGVRAWVGDVVVTRHNDRRLSVNNGQDFVKNGDTWEVRTVCPDGSAVLTHRDHGGKITLDPHYLAEHTQLGYAASIHRAQGATVDTAHALVDERTERAAAYVATSRGRERNQIYVSLTSPEQTRDEVLETIAGAYDRDLSAHETVIEASRAGTSVAELAATYGEVYDAAYDHRLEAITRAQIGDPNTETLKASDAWGAVTANLRAAEDHGLDAGGILAQSWAERSLAGAKDPAAVMAWRIERRTEAAVEQITTGGHRPFSQVSDELLDTAIQRSPHYQRRVLDDTQWIARPYAWVPTEALSAQADVQRAAADTEDGGMQQAAWRAETMSAELERRAGLSPDQRAVEQIARGDRPRSRHELDLHTALSVERDTRQILAPQAPQVQQCPAGGGVSEALAPSRLRNDPQVPARHREALDKLHARMQLRVQTRGAQLAQDPPAWAQALGPVPARAQKRATWHQIAAEVEALRSRYKIAEHEHELIPTRFTDETAASLRAQATAVHKHSALTTKAPAQAGELAEVADIAAAAERAATGTSPAQAAVDVHRAQRAATGELPEPQRQAHTAAVAAPAETTAEPATGRDAFVAAAIARARDTGTAGGAGPEGDRKAAQQAPAGSSDAGEQQQKPTSAAAFTAAVAARAQQNTPTKETPVTQSPAEKNTTEQNAAEKNAAKSRHELRREQARKYAPAKPSAAAKRAETNAEASRKAAQQATRDASQRRSR